MPLLLRACNSGWSSADARISPSAPQGSAAVVSRGGIETAAAVPIGSSFFLGRAKHDLSREFRATSTRDPDQTIGEAGWMFVSFGFATGPGISAGGGVRRRLVGAVCGVVERGCPRLPARLLRGARAARTAVLSGSKSGRTPDVGRGLVAILDDMAGVPPCLVCGAAIGVHEPIVVVGADSVRRTSVATEHALWNERLVHIGCVSGTVAEALAEATTRTRAA
jgi:hypothetical protein